MENHDPETTLRRGPTPLPVHIGLAMAEYTRLQQAGSVPQHEMEKMLAGIRKYQQHSFYRDMTPLPVVWQSGEVKLYYNEAENAAVSLLLVPSLINRSYILDLLPERSFVRWLARQGIGAYLLDWGSPVADPMLHNIDTLVSERLGAAIAATAEASGGPVYALGYCMGGTLLAAAAATDGSFLRGLVFLASPWDFAAGDRRLTREVVAGTPSALQMAQQNGYLPMDWIQSVFAAVNADRAMQKFSEFAALDNESEKARLFVAVEDWLNDGVDMPEGLAQTCIVDWFGRNLPGGGKWVVNDAPVDLSKLSIPSLVVASENDRLVPKGSSLALARMLANAEVLQPQSGHIGMMTGSRARAQVWEPVAAWLKRA